MSSMRRSVTPIRTVDGVADPSPDVGNWRRSLRILDPEARKRLSYSGNLFKSRDFSQSIPKPDDLDGMAALEKEYVKSLQQQIYLLELENIHLRSQSPKAASMQSTASGDAERMLLELRSLDAKVEALRLESSRKDASVELLQQRILHLTSGLSGLEDTRLSGRLVETQSTEELQRERDALQRRVARLRARLGELEAGGGLLLDGELRSPEGRVRELRDQLALALDKLARADAAILSEREAVSRLDSQVRRMERKLQEEAAAKVDIQRRQRQHLEASAAAAVRPEDLAALAKHNAALEAAVRRLQTELLMRTRPTTAGGSEDDEAARLRERERQLEEHAARNAQEASELRQRLTRLEAGAGADGVGGVAELTRQCQRLQADNSQLAGHVRQLEAALERKQAEKAAARAAVDGSEVRLGQLQAELSRLQQLQASRWSEVEKIATTIKSAAKSNSDIFDRP